MRYFWSSLITNERGRLLQNLKCDVFHQSLPYYIGKPIPAEKRILIGSLSGTNSANEYGKLRCTCSHEQGKEVAKLFHITFFSDQNFKEKDTI